MSRFDEIQGVMAMAVLDPNVLNYYQLLSPGVASGLAAVVTAISVALALLISRSFFRSYTFAGFGYLLGLPVGFAFLGASYLFELASVLFMSHPILHPAFFWIQMLLQAEAFALIALSYYYKNSAGDRRSHVSRDVAITILPLLMVAVPFIAPTSVLIAQPYFNYTGFADMSFFMRLFDIIVIGYIFKSTVVSLVKAANLRLLYVPAAFALLWLEQYSLVIAYFDNSTVAFVGSALARIAGLAAFAYVMHRIFNRRIVEIEARKAT
ncbi:MAG TPA: hypothetical protein VJP79_09235 [Nitrososphaera sp.]|nr:hypothetical protein [Nitrososphaera sp.]